MSKRPKTADPALVAIRDRERKAIATFERWYLRAKRAFRAMEKARQQAIRLGRKANQMEANSSDNGKGRKQKPGEAPGKEDGL